MQQNTINWTHNEEDFKFLHIGHVEKFEIKPHVEKFQISPHDRRIEIWNFSTWLIFSSQLPSVRLWQIWGMILVECNATQFNRMQCNGQRVWSRPDLVCSLACDRPDMSRLLWISSSASSCFFPIRKPKIIQSLTYGRRSCWLLFCLDQIQKHLFWIHGGEGLVDESCYSICCPFTYVS